MAERFYCMSYFVKFFIELCLFLASWLLFCGVSYCGIWERGFMFDYDTKEKEHQNTRQSDLYSGASRINQIASCFDSLSIT
jgi:hypothetical protein